MPAIIPKDSPGWGPEALLNHAREIAAYQETTAEDRRLWMAKNKYFYDYVYDLIAHIVEPAKSVLCVRCEDGSLLKAVQANPGTGIDLTEKILDWAREIHPQFKYHQGTPEAFEFAGACDYIIFNWISETVDMQSALMNLRGACNPDTRLVIFTYSHLWEGIVKLAEKFGLKPGRPQQNWLSEHDLKNLLHLSGFELLKTYRTILCPKRIPLISGFMNRFLAHLPLIEKLCMIKVVVAKPVQILSKEADVNVSVIIPCKNEAGNIRSAVQRMPGMGNHTEIIFCDDNSTDTTVAEIRECQAEFPEKDIKLINGPGICKSKNVWAGFQAASGDVLMILDADLTVMPEELPLFYNAIVCGHGDFINGARLVYPVPKAAMKIFNMIGNRVFSYMFSYVINQYISDTLCGTKVLWKKDWERLRPMIGSWGTEDRWGDYELLLGASKLNLKILDLPVHYQERLFGQSKMVRVFKNGLRMVAIIFYGFKKLRLRA